MINFKILKKKIKNIKGNSLAEFAVTTAMMATLATTAAPRFSGIGEGAKEKKTLAEIDKIVIASSNFFNSKVTTEGRGRFPGQEKYNFKVGWYDDESKLIKDLQEFDSYTYQRSWRWKSVFGAWWSEAPKPEDARVWNDQIEPCDNCPTSLKGHERFREIFGGILKSPYQDGHYIYAVIPGGGTGEGFFPPVMYVADLENPSQINNLMVP